MMKNSRRILTLSLASLMSIGAPATSLASQEKYQDNKILEQNESEASGSQKQDYYEQYLKIASEVSAESGQELIVLPFDELKESDWVTPSEFRQVAEGLSNYKIEISEDSLDDISLFSTATKTKKVSIKAGSITETLSISGSFETQYSSFHSRQMFAGVNYIKSSIPSSSSGSWRQIDYDYSLIDGGRTYSVTVSGTYTRLGLSTNLYAHTEFYCSANGGIS